MKILKKIIPVSFKFEKGIKHTEKPEKFGSLLYSETAEKYQTKWHKDFIRGVVAEVLHNVVERNTSKKAAQEKIRVLDAGCADGAATENILKIPT
ncbi:hypothetical protein ACFLZV_06370, partial [Candidatus Margulisiibacteriota bacterium]